MTNLIGPPFMLKKSGSFPLPCQQQPLMSRPNSFFPINSPLLLMSLPMMQRKKNPLAIRIGHEAIYLKIQLVLEVSSFHRSLRCPWEFYEFRISHFFVYHETPFFQPNAKKDTASLYQFPNIFLAIPTDNTQFVELGASSLRQCSGNNRIRLCRESFFNN